MISASLAIFHLTSISRLLIKVGALDHIDTFGYDIIFLTDHVEVLDNL